MTLDFSKKIIKAVSFDRALFQKELKKILNWLNDSGEMKIFQEWCITEFGSKYPKIIQSTFKNNNIEVDLLRIEKKF